MKKFLYRIYERILFHLRGTPKPVKPINPNPTTEELVNEGLVVGKRFYRGPGVIIDRSHFWQIHIGDNVTLAPRVHILAHDSSTFNFLGYTRIGNVNIGNTVFVGASTVILPGVTIGDNVVIGANSTVSRDIPSNSVAVGSPARVVCSIDDFIVRNKELMKTRPCYGEDYTLRGPITKEKKEQMYRELQDGIGFVM
jgi:maltose O-acetyltransferase